MKFVSSLGRLASFRASGDRCPQCGAMASDGIVLDDHGTASCLPCSILRSLGYQEHAQRMSLGGGRIAALAPGRTEPSLAH